ncbi:MAG: LynF/TruF/PatF family peptide O-prenyltransferase [Coleofasciculus sp. G1-WW12-02]|uniref:LynF/TruF/PatF family peptide O-prenyltransferase n=1 Tax=Coleofasciculus sp. G1-WW12-02 TaxID=3068483 RepID=UPI0032FDFEC3
MVLNQLFRQSSLRERRLQFLRTHLDAFEVEPVFPLPIYEEVLLQMEGICGVESTCQVVGNQLFAGCFDVSDIGTDWRLSIDRQLQFFLGKVESRVGIKFNCNLLEQFVGIHRGSSQILDASLGLHRYPHLKDSFVKICFHLDPKTDPGELVKTAMAIDGSCYSLELTQVLLKDTFIIAFNLFFDGRSEIELYPGAPGGKHGEQGHWGQDLTLYIRKHFGKKVNDLFSVSNIVAASFSRAKAEPILHFSFTNIKEIPNSFRFNNLGNRIYSFCESQDCIAYAIVGATEKNLESSRLEHFYFSYNRYDSGNATLVFD